MSFINSISYIDFRIEKASDLVDLVDFEKKVDEAPLDLRKVDLNRAKQYLRNLEERGYSSQQYGTVNQPVDDKCCSCAGDFDHSEASIRG